MWSLRRMTRRDIPRVRRLWRDHWAGEEMIVHGEVFHPDQLQGFIAQDWAGLVTYAIRGKQCEIISLNSLRPGRGIGQALIASVAREAQRRGCRRMIVSTTNDNLRALGFYQKVGFEIATIRRGAVKETRKRKPGISMIGQNGIPIRDEIELELLLPEQRLPRPCT